MKKRIATALCTAVAVSAPIVAPAASASPAVTVPGVVVEQQAVKESETPQIFHTERQSKTLRTILIVFGIVVGVLAFISVFASRILGLFGIRF
ncbi:hypothetical protein CMUST_12085 [Corynebacterium mustelae]|uniref:Uncharacterized protein n=1 Tax=Corynebacterium mustelae TaxID=571915 RepID=A0A0G3H4I1_9CORY|nr:hypothetical protein [Corynebacterium mustelae]AKK06728.1 hypothetical protein CMUST_12085 [Corynebacterium mustelae]